MPTATPTDTSRARHARFLKLWRESPEQIERHRDAAPATTARPDRRRAFRRYREWLWPRRGALLKVALLGTAGIALDLAWPLVSRHLIDEVVLDAGRPLADRKLELVFVAGLMLVVFLLASVANFLRQLRTTLLTSHLAFDLRVRLFDRILRLPLDQVQGLKTGGVIARLSTDVDNTTGLVQNALLSPLLAGLRLVATLAVMFVLEWRLALAAAVIMPPIMLVHARFIRRVRPIWRATRGPARRSAGSGSSAASRASAPSAARTRSGTTP